MNSNINDPAAIAALLEQLKSSTAWQELTASTRASNDNGELRTVPSSSGYLLPQNLPSNAAGHNTPDAGSSVASLLSQLNSFPTDPVPDQHAAATTHDFGRKRDEIEMKGPSAVPVQSLPSTSGSRGFLPGRVEPSQDLSKFTFRQALPLVSGLVDDASFIFEINKMRNDQDALERRLWLDREAIYAKYQEKIKVAQTRAQMIGVVISQHELNMIADAFKKELFKFDLEHVIPAWDGLASRQQLELSQLNVPTMCVTGDNEHLKRQQQVIQLLESLVGPKVSTPAV
ncbi:hypothetical protein CPB84DRAFT_1820066 [Gymnopilus junonius]|uniref:Uncharacterized protein n=1 Tax=Gymnopilus junonius TaxID=109634 RepID=A0A9P5TVZ0_GYMJU|nr:hypothetical protein CPB84DRAFT_1820066 [Gymnopilus junonius]